MSDKITNYRVMADTKAAPNQESTQVSFIQPATDYKDAWVKARGVCRTGGTMKDENGQDVTISAGTLTVRKVFTTQKRGGSKSKVITAEMLIAAAKEHNIAISQKLQALFDEMTGGTQAQGSGEGQQAAA
jgi:hypothetical protein